VQKISTRKKIDVDRTVVTDAEEICRSQLLAHDHAQAPAPAFREPHAHDLKFRRETIQELVRCRMESQRRRDEIDKRRSLLQGNAWKIAVAGDLPVPQLPANTQPVIRGLERQVNVLAFSSMIASCPNRVTVRRSRIPCSPPALVKT